MKEINLIYIGKSQYPGVEETSSKLLKRITPFASCNQYEIKEKKGNDLEKYSVEINKLIKRKKSAIIVFTPEGKQLSSEKFSYTIFNNLELYDALFFIIGGRNGIPKSIKQKAVAKISFSNMVFGHQIFRLMAVEQIYRAFAIKNGINYH